MALSMLRFGARSREMVGVCQQPLSDVASGPGVLLCRPISQEATRTAAMFRVISERLAREGCTVLRFDYHGTADSPGEEGEQSLDGWTQDVLAAQDTMARICERPQCWFGMGLGANLALRAAVQSARPPDRLVLWEPVVDGASYVQALLSGHRAELAREFQSTWSRLLAQGKATEPTLPGHVLGFEFGPQLATELRGLPAPALQPALARGVQVVCAIHDDVAALQRAHPEHARLHWHRIQRRTDWLASQAQGTAIVPPEVFEVLLPLVRQP